MSSKPTICLCMIVRDEAHVLARCLASVRPIIDAWVVVDTGSTDGTQEVARTALAGIDGILHERPWVDFAHNRSEALAFARCLADYALIIDADDTLELPSEFFMPALTADLYTFDIAYRSIVFRRAQLLRNALPWRYKGVLHEYPHSPGVATIEHLAITMRQHHDGRRSIEPATYAKDVALLENALKSERDPHLVARYTFYLAQSYRDCGKLDLAVEWYLARASLGQWEEEVYVSLCEAARAMRQLRRDPDEALATYARASEVVPTRAEAAHGASRLCRALKRHAQGYAIAEPALDLAAPAKGLFVERWVYDYGLRDEFAVHAYWTGNYHESLKSNLAALQTMSVPAKELARILRNMRFALDKLDTQRPIQR